VFPRNKLDVKRGDFRDAEGLRQDLAGDRKDSVWDAVLTRFWLLDRCMDGRQRGVDSDGGFPEDGGDEVGSPDELRQPGSAAPSLSKRWWSRVSDGEQVWGSVDISVHRDGFRSYRLVVFPPGISPSERRYVRWWRAWPTWGLLCWFLLLVGSGSVLSPWAALATSTTAYLAAGLVVRALAGKIRSQVRTLRVVKIQGHVDEAWAAKYALLERMVDLLANADALREQGRLSVVDHEVTWWRVYDCLSPDRAGFR
jgi:hypothetical protein